MTIPMPEGESYHVPQLPPKSGKEVRMQKRERRAQPFIVPERVIDQGISATIRYQKDHDAERVAAIEREHSPTNALLRVEKELSEMQAERIQQEIQIIQEHPGVIFHENGEKIFCEDRE